MQIDIPQQEVYTLLDKVKSAMAEHSISSEIINGTKIIVIHPSDWEVSLLVPYKNTKPSVIRKQVENILYGVCGIEDRCCDYFGKQRDKGAYEWYFRHPNTPRDIYERLDEKLEMEIEEELGGQIGMGLPKPNRYKVNDAPAFVTVREDVFLELESGKKDTEYRSLNQYYCDKFFPSGIQKKLIKFNRGYKSGRENQMVFEIRDIVFVSDRGEEAPSKDLFGKPIISFADIPHNFAPVAYGIKLGRRIS